MDGPPMKAFYLNIYQSILLAISTLTVLAGATIAPSLPYIADYFSQSPHSEFWAQLALAIPGICVAISAAWIGKQSAIKNRPPLLIVALLGYGALGVAYLLAPHQLLLLLASRAALGVCVAIIMIMTTVLLIKDQSPQKSRQLLGYQAAAGSFGGVLYMALANELTQWHGLAPFALYSIAWLFAILLWLLLPTNQTTNTPNEAETKEVKSRETRPNEIQPRDNDHDKKPCFLLFSVLASIEMLALYALVLQIPLLSIASPYLLSVGLTIMLLVMSVTAALYGWLQQIISKATQHALGLIILAIGFCVLASELAMAYSLSILLALCGMGIGFGLLRPNLVAWLFSKMPADQRPRIMGKLTSVFFSAQFIAPFIIYPLVSLVNTQFMWLFFASICAFAFIYLLRKEVLGQQPSPRYAFK